MSCFFLRSRSGGSSSSQLPIDACPHEPLGVQLGAGGWFPLTIVALLFTLMSTWRLRNASSRSDYFGLPPNRVVELGVQLSL